MEILLSLNKIKREEDDFLQNYFFKDYATKIKICYDNSFQNSYLKKKSDNMNPNVGFQMMLSCIPKVSSVVSKRISTKYSTIHDFLEKINKINKDERVNFIQNIKTNDQNGRKISKTAASNIVEYLCN